MRNFFFKIIYFVFYFSPLKNINILNKLTDINTYFRRIIFKLSRVNVIIYLIE